MKSNVNDLALFLLRLALGAIMWAHGAQKLLGLFGGPGPQGFVAMVGRLGMPPALAWLVIAVEFFGGIAIVFGILSRLAALGFAVEMVVGIVKVHFANGFFIHCPKVGFEYAMVLGVVAFALLLTGPGKFSLFGRTRNLLA